MHICYDDLNWLDQNEFEQTYKLDCVYQEISSINLIEASALFAHKVSVSYWNSITYEKVDCASDIFAWDAFKLNYTYTAQQECDRTLNKVSGFRQGASCRMEKGFLQSTIFKTQRYILESRHDIYPYPYGLTIRYSCN